MQKYIVTNRAKLFTLLFLATLCSQCTKLVDVNPPVTSVTSETVYNNDATAIAVLTGIYANLSYAGFTGVSLPSIPFYTGLSSDELSLWSGITSPNTIEYYRNALSPNIAGYEMWNFLYPYVFSCNDAITGINNSNSLTPAVKQQLLGEAKFMRAFFYFYLVNFYGDVPLAVSNDYKINAVLPRAPVAQVYGQIIQDLQNARSLLSDNYLDVTLLNTTTERVRPTAWAASALLARADLFSGNWAGADSAASQVIAQPALYQLDTLNGVFLKNSNEAIWQLQPVNAESNTEDAKLFIIPVTGLNMNNSVYLSEYLLNSFEAGDARRTDWVDSISQDGLYYYYPYKYKSATEGDPVTEYTMVLRLAEQYLIRAEARTQEGNIPGAQSDLNMIRTRANLGVTDANDKLSLLSAILRERQVELFTEWGNRWFDLKRTNTIDAVMGAGGVTAAKGGSWSPNWALYPLPLADLQTDVNLVQNQGY